MFYPFASSYMSKNVKCLCKSFANDKKREYNERIIQVEHGSFSPLIFLSTGSMGPEAEIVIKKLAADIAAKRNVL